MAARPAGPHGDEFRELVDDVRDRLTRLKGLSLHRKRKLEARLFDVEEQAAVEALLHLALFRAALDAGLFQDSEFLYVLRTLDLLDGVADGRWGRRKPGPSESSSP